MVNHLKIVTCNVRGIKQTVKRHQLFKYFHEKQYNIVLLQETHSVKSKEKIWRNEWGGKIVFGHGASNARGTAILFAKGVNPEIHNTIRDENGRVLVTKFNLGEREFLITNIYAPNTDDPVFFSEVLQNIQNWECDHKIIGGDLNLNLDPGLDKRGGDQKVTSKAANLVNCFLKKIIGRIFGGFCIRICFNSRGIDPIR